MKKIKRCTICDDPEGIWTIEATGFGGTTTNVFYMCKACDRSMRRILGDRIHASSAIWVLKRMLSTRIKKLKREVEYHKKDVEALTKLCNRYALEKNNGENGPQGETP